MFQENLISLRKLNGLSQEELAEKVGISRQTLSKGKAHLWHGKGRRQGTDRDSCKGQKNFPDRAWR